MIFIKLLLLSIISVFASSLPGYAASDAPGTEALLVDRSYIVTFKASSFSQPGLIQPGLRQQGMEPRFVSPFGEHSTGQSREALAAALGLQGRVLSIFETIHAAHIEMDASEAERLRNNPNVVRVEQNMRGAVTQTVQLYPGWALDRLDQTTTALNGQYVFNANGAGQTVYILDSGLDLANQNVAAQFGNRASVLWDVNGGTGADCIGHGLRLQAPWEVPPMVWPRAPH
jgi:hypothetical protein